MYLQTSSRSFLPGIPEGFGQRLKEERKRVKKTQSQLAEIGKVGRLAQIQYEAETTSPTTRYLSLIASAGVDLAYLVLGVRFGGGELTPEQHQSVDAKAFELVERSAEAQANGKLSAESRRMLHHLFFAFLSQVERGELPADADPNALIPGHVVRMGQR